MLDEEAGDVGAQPVRPVGRVVLEDEDDGRDRRARLEPGAEPEERSPEGLDLPGQLDRARLRSIAEDQEMGGLQTDPVVAFGRQPFGSGLGISGEGSERQQYHDHGGAKDVVFNGGREGMGVGCR